MRVKFEYDTKEEREQLIHQHKDLILIEEQNITEGNFLIFSDKPLPTEITYTQVPKEELDDLKNKTDMQESTMEEVLFNIIPNMGGK